MTKALIFNMQKFSIHDGPGIRTTIFFKGCPLKCLWCSNPESQDTSVAAPKLIQCNDEPDTPLTMNTPPY